MAELLDPALVFLIQPRKRKKQEEQEEVYEGPQFNGPPLSFGSRCGCNRGKAVRSRLQSAASGADNTEVSHSDLHDADQLYFPERQQPATQAAAEGLSEWAQRKKTQSENWADLVQSGSHELVGKAHFAASLHADLQNILQSSLQQQLDEAWRGHQCPSGVNCKTAASMEAAGISLMGDHSKCHYLSFSHRFPVTLHYWSCSHCEEKCFTSHPTHVGCWFSSPCLPSFLYDLTIMTFYQHAQRSGLSITGVCGGSCAPQTYLDSYVHMQVHRVLTLLLHVVCAMQTSWRCCTKPSTATCCTRL
jgi:hypothetical protein